MGVSTFVFSEEGGDKMCRVVVINIYFGSAPVPGQLNLLLKTLSLPSLLQTQLTSKGGQIPGKRRWLN